MKKYIAILMALLCAVLLTGCQMQTELGAAKDYPVSGEVTSLRMQINAADIAVKEGDSFRVESNLKKLTVNEQNGVLTIREETKAGVTYSDAMLTLYVPAGTVFGYADISTGAGRLTADALRAEALDLQLGAGAVEIGYLEAAREADIEGGAGAVTVADGSLMNLELEMGLGELTLTAALLGDCELSLGVGESDLTLLGDEADYSVEIEKGLGTIKVNGNTVSAYRSTGGSNRVDIEGGVGEINLMFQ